MTKWKHLTFDNRKVITNLLTKDYKLVQIASILEMDPTSISKEIKRNRVSDDRTRVSNAKPCKRLDRYPYVCNACPKKYTSCPLQRLKYEASSAQALANYRLVNSRKGINMTEDEYEYLDQQIKTGVENNHSIYHIVKSDPKIEVSTSNVYKLINEGKLTTKKHNLPYAVTYKKRKSRKEYEYNENRAIDRTNRTYIDFLKLMKDNMGTYHVQMDFLGAIKTDKKSILTLTFPDLHYVMLFIVKSKNQIKIISLFDQIEKQIGINNFKIIFPCILTDRDPSFSDFISLETSTVTGEKRTNMFYCDSFNSSQKANVEQMNKQLRKFFPKGKSVDHLDQYDIHLVQDFINKQRILSLSGATPKEAFELIYGSEVQILLNNIIDHL